MGTNGFDEQPEGYEDMGEDDLYYALDDDRRAELNEMVGLKVLGIELWEESIADEEEDEPVAPEERMFVDCDLYLDDNVALELYVASVYPDPDGDPVVGVDEIFAAVGKLADDNLELVDYGEADEEEGGIALAFGRGDNVQLVVVAQAWMVSDWEPDEEGDGLDGEEA
ncbi:MAG: hypothetical protein MUC34_08595 [Anaerolineae bacterium]|jgi:hypothetical protein|nr:hypothetical protein [Anaerolineae bacterium]